MLLLEQVGNLLQVICNICHIIGGESKLGHPEFIYMSIGTCKHLWNMIWWLISTKIGHSLEHPWLQSWFSSRRLFTGFAYMLERSIWCHKASVQMALSSAKYWNSGRKLSLLYVTRKQNPCVSTAGSTPQTTETLLSNNFSPLVGLRSSEISHVWRTPAQTPQPTPVAQHLTDSDSVCWCCSSVCKNFLYSRNTKLSLVSGIVRPLLLFTTHEAQVAKCNKGDVRQPILCDYGSFLFFVLMPSVMEQQQSAPEHTCGTIKMIPDSLTGSITAFNTCLEPMY